MDVCVVVSRAGAQGNTNYRSYEESFHVRAFNVTRPQILYRLPARVNRCFAREAFARWPGLQAALRNQTSNETQG